MTREEWDPDGGRGWPQGMRGRAPEPCWPRLAPADSECSRRGEVRQEPMEGRGTPAPMPTRRPAAKLEEMLCQSEQGPVRFQIAAKNLLDQAPSVGSIGTPAGSRG
jgi:hypothetical protein